nr:RNA-dependent RNA polymerase [Nigrospora aurantiaca tobamo-like virus 1]
MSSNFAEGRTVEAPLETLKTVLDEALPGSALIDAEFDNTMLEYSDVRMVMEGEAKLTLSKFDAVPKPRRTLKPKLRTSAAPGREPTARGALASLIKRNFGADYIASPLGFREFAKRALENMMDVFCVDDWRERVKQFEPIRPSKEAVAEWARAQNTTTLSALEKVEWEHAQANLQESVEVYELILKSMPKTATDDKPLSAIPAVQTIMFHPKYINAFFGPITRSADKRFRSLLRSNCLINKGKNLDTIENFLKTQYMSGFGGLNVENDFSNYDRSQGELALFLDLAFLALMGVDEDTMDLWLRGHCRSTNISYRLGIVVYLWMQRKSGDVMTSDGNTRYNMTSLAYCLRLKSEEVVCSMFLGDDSFFQLIDSKSLRMRVKDCAERLGVIFNATAKTLYSQIGYFCGYFILETADGPVVASDPYRRIVKLGRWDIRSRDLLKEHWISFKDTLRNYERLDVQEALAEACLERMPRTTVGVNELAVASLYTLKKSYKEFLQFWEDKISITYY